LSWPVNLSRTESITCRTLFGFDLVTDGWGAWEPLACGLSEIGETLLVLRLLPYLEYVLEVGAGNGYFAFLAAQNGVAVTALEPSPLEYKQLIAGAALNGLTNITAPVCTAGDSAQGGALYLEDGPLVKPLSLGDYRAAGSLVRLAAPGVGPALLRGAGDWLSAYDAPVVLVSAVNDPEGGMPGQAQAAIKELARFDYSLYAASRQPVDGAPLLTPLGGAVHRLTASFLALPPMAHDLADQLTKPVDMRTLTPTAKLENLFYFVKNSFEAL
jgi:SAM-dependent methyltransferase